MMTPASSHACAWRSAPADAQMLHASRAHTRASATPAPARPLCAPSAPGARSAAADPRLAVPGSPRRRGRGRGRAPSGRYVSSPSPERSMIFSWKSRLLSVNACARALRAWQTLPCPYSRLIASAARPASPLPPEARLARARGGGRGSVRGASAGRTPDSLECSLKAARDIFILRARATT